MCALAIANKVDRSSGLELLRHKVVSANFLDVSREAVCENERARTNNQRRVRATKVCQVWRRWRFFLVYQRIGVSLIFCRPIVRENWERIDLVCYLVIVGMPTCTILPLSDSLTFAFRAPLFPATPESANTCFPRRFAPNSHALVFDRASIIDSPPNRTGASCCNRLASFQPSKREVNLPVAESSRLDSTFQRHKGTLSFPLSFTARDYLILYPSKVHRNRRLEADFARSTRRASRKNKIRVSGARETRVWVRKLFLFQLLWKFFFQNGSIPHNLALVIRKRIAPTMFTNKNWTIVCASALNWYYVEWNGELLRL